MRRSLFLLLTLASMSTILSGCSSNDDVPVTVNREELVVDEDDFESMVSTTESDITATEEPEVTDEPTVEPTAEPITESSQTTSSDAQSAVSISYVKDLITTLMSSTSQSDIDTYLQGIVTDSQFTFSPIVNQETKVSIENIGINSSNSNEYLGIVTLRQAEGISQFSVLVTFADSKLSSFVVTKF